MDASSGRTCLLSLGTSRPPYLLNQAHAAWFMKQVLTHSPATRRRDQALALVERIYPRSGIETRACVLPDYGKSDPNSFSFYPRDWALEPFPSTARRMELFERLSVSLALTAAQRALERSELSPGDVTHLIVCTCTGFFAPGLDVALVEKMGLRRDVSRTLLGFMGCYAGFSGMRLAGEIVRANRKAVVLVVCVELCSLHFQKRPLPDLLVGNALFADGSSAAVFAGMDSPGHSALATLEISRSLVTADSREQMSWRIGETGFEMRLSKQVPASLGTWVGGFIGNLLAARDLSMDKVLSWAIHPGGRKIIEHVQQSLGLSDEEVAPSRRVLRDCGNMSSATLFFVLDDVLRRTPPGQLVTALGFGPGLTMEGAVLKAC